MPRVWEPRADRLLILSPMLGSQHPSFPGVNTQLLTANSFISSPKWQKPSKNLKTQTRRPSDRLLTLVPTFLNSLMPALQQGNTPHSRTLSVPRKQQLVPKPCRHKWWYFSPQAAGQPPARARLPEAIVGIQGSPVPRAVQVLGPFQGRGHEEQEGSVHVMDGAQVTSTFGTDPCLGVDVVVKGLNTHLRGMDGRARGE